MNWITKVTPPGLKTMLAKKDTPDDLWVKCPLSGELVYKTDLEENWHVTPAGAHLRISPRTRLRHGNALERQSSSRRLVVYMCSAAHDTCNTGHSSEHRGRQWFSLLHQYKRQHKQGHPRFRQPPVLSPLPCTATPVGVSVRQTPLRLSSAHVAVRQEAPPGTRSRRHTQEDAVQAMATLLPGRKNLPARTH